MSFRSLGKLFKIRNKNEKRGSEEIALQIEGFEQCVQLILAYLGKDVSKFSIVENCKCDKKSEVADSCTGIHGTAVLRYIGRSHGLAGADPFEDLEIDQTVDVFIDFIQKILTLEKEENSVIRAEKVLKFKESECLEFLNKFDAVIAANGGHLALNKLTWADFLLTGMWDHIKEVLQVNNDKFPNIKRLLDNVMSIPNVKLALDKLRE